MILSFILAAHIACAQSPEPTGSPVSREALAAIMKHPTEPRFDPLRPLSGRWIRCRPNENDPAFGSTQDRYSSSDRSHFSHLLAKASDKECKSILNEQRTSYECDSSNKQTLSCKALKIEMKTGDGPWALVKMSDSDLEGSSLKLSFVGLPTQSHKTKKHSQSEDAAKPKSDGHKLELRLTPDATGEAESVQLDFSPVTLRPKKIGSP